MPEVQVSEHRKAVMGRRDDGLGFTFERERRHGFSDRRAGPRHPHSDRRKGKRRVTWRWIIVIFVSITFLLWLLGCAQAQDRTESEEFFPVFQPGGALVCTDAQTCYEKRD